MTSPGSLIAAVRPIAGATIVALLLSATMGCDSRSEVRGRIDHAWFRQNLIDAHLSRWLRAAPTDNGFFRTAVDRSWTPKSAQPGDIVSHTRTLFVMAAGFEVTRDPAYLEQVRRGADFLLAHFHDAQYGGWFAAVAPDGKMINGNKRLYGQAFVIFGLAHAYRVTKDERYAQAAFATWREINLRFADGLGGFRPAFTRDFARSQQSHNSQNPIMHLFEALLALYDSTASPEILRDTRSLGDFVIYKLLQGDKEGGAYIPELYDADWKPLPQDRGGHVDVGHQFEWAYMLSVAAQRGINPIYLGVSERLLKYALDHGYEHGVGGAFTSIRADGKVDRHKGFWQQAEALRALMHHAAVNGRGDLWGYVTQTLEIVRSEFLDEENGGWYAVPRDECRKSAECLDTQPDGYHMTGMHLEALRISAQ